MPRKIDTEKVESNDAGHTVARCRQALAAGGPSAIYTAYWEQQLEYATKREAQERARREADA